MATNISRNPDDRIFNRVISVISVVQRETTLTITDSIETGSPLVSEIVRVVSLSTTEITEITGFRKTGPQGRETLKSTSGALKLRDCMRKDYKTRNKKSYLFCSQGTKLKIILAIKQK